MKFVRKDGTTAHSASGEADSDDELPARLFRRHEQMKRLAEEMCMRARSGAYAGLPALIEEFDRICTAQAKDRDGRMFGLLHNWLRSDPGRLDKLEQIEQTIGHYVAGTRDFVARWREQRVGPEEAGPFCRDVQHLLDLLKDHAIYAGRNLFPLYLEMEWQSSSLTRPPAHES